MNELKTRFEKINVNIVEGHFEIGLLLKEKVRWLQAEHEQFNTRRYGAHLFERLGVALDIHPRVLHDCLATAERFSVEEYRSRIVTPGITWSHARLLAYVADRETRDRLIDATIKEEL